MSVILLPDKWRRQPRGPIAVRPQWVGRGLTALYVLNAQSWRINAVTGAIGGTASGAWHTYEPESITSSGNGTEHIDFAVGVTPATIVISYAMISGVVAWSNLRRDTIVWSGLYDQQTTTSEDFAGVIGPLPTRGIGIPTYAFRWAEQNNYRGVADGGTVQVDTSTGAVPGDRTFISLGIAKRGGIADNPSETRATLIAAFSQGLSDPEMQAITAAPWGELVRKQPRILYFTAPSGGGATIAGSGTPTAQASTVSGTAERSVTGSGTPTAQASTVAGIAERVITSSGALASQSSAVAGSGSVGNAISGSGTLLAQSSQVAGTAERSVTGTGAPASQAATVSGTAERAVTGTGAPTSQSSTASGTGQVGNVVTGSGSPTAQSATVSGTAERTVTSSGALSAQSSTVAGTAERTITGSGALSAQSSAVYGFDAVPVVPDTGGGGSRTVAFSSKKLRQELEEWEQKNQDKERLKRLMREDEELVLIMLALAA